MTMKSKQEMIDNIMDNFYFSRVAKCMEVLEWKWHDVEGIPTEPDIRQFARKYMHSVKDTYTSNRYSLSTGGFVIKAWYEDGKLDAMELSFVVAGWDAGTL